MKLPEFQQLCFADQIAQIKDAVCVGSREGGNYTAYLYQVDTFYIEAFMHKKYLHFFRIEGFDDTDKLDAYLNKFQMAHPA